MNKASSQAFIALLWILALLLGLDTANAEVMDKELPLTAIWANLTVCSCLTFMAGYRSLWFLLITLPFLAISLWQLQEILDPFVGPAIQNEAGPVYLLSSYAQGVVPIGFFLVGYWLKQRTR